jgi:hypothetical protein
VVGKVPGSIFLNLIAIFPVTVIPGLSDDLDAVHGHAKEMILGRGF